MPQRLAAGAAVPIPDGSASVTAPSTFAASLAPGTSVAKLHFYKALQLC